MTALVVLLLKSLLVFAACGLSLIALRRASAAARHLVCLLTLIALLALPCLSLMLPGWQVFPALTPPAIPAPLMSAPPVPPTNNPIPARKLVTLPSEGRDKPTANPLASAPPPRPFPWPLFLLSVWTLGVLLTLTRPLLGLWGIRQLSRLSVPVTETALLALAADCAAALRLRRLSELRQAAVPVPMTWGSRRPVLLLPQGAETWPEDRLRAVLLHEMAHVRRRDWLAHRLADITCALYWFHPLVWLGARRLRAEGEIACDDLVLTSGIPAPDYARHLLEIARALPPASILPQAAIAMTQTSKIEGRLQMILDKTRNRRMLPRRVLLTVLGIGATALVPFAMLRPAITAVPSPSIPISSWQRTLSDGTVVELIGVSGYPATQNGWRKPSGSPLAQPPYDHIDSTLGTYWKHGREFALRVTPPPGVAADAVSTRFEVEGAAATSYETPSAHGRLLPDLWAVLIQADKLPPLSSIRCGVASGPWVTWLPDGDSEVNFGPKSVSGSFYGTSGNLLFSPASEIHGNAVITVTNTFLNAECRVVAVDINGKVFNDNSVGSAGIGQLHQTTCVFKGLPLKRVKEFRFQGRTYQWTEFKNVALQPAK